MNRSAALFRLLALWRLSGHRADGLTSMKLTTPLRALVLHGKGGCGASMARRFAPISDALDGAVQFEFMTAPHALGGDDASGDEGFAWWSQRPAGARSYEADAFEGWDESLAAVERRWDDAGGYDVLWGHSQGAILLAVLLARARVAGGDPAGVSSSSSPRVLRPAAWVLNGCAWPKPFEAELLAAGDLARPGASDAPCPRSLHVCSKEDTINPCGQAFRVAACTSPGSELLLHGGGHVVPVDAASIAKYGNFLFPRGGGDGDDGGGITRTTPDSATA